MLRQPFPRGRVAKVEGGGRMLTKQQYRRLMNEYQATGNVTESATKADVGRPLRTEEESAELKGRSPQTVNRVFLRKESQHNGGRKEERQPLLASTVDQVGKAISSSFVFWRT